ncbi:MAG: pyruvate, phosphate dikinase [Chloroflexota bacterium]
MSKKYVWLFSEGRADMRDLLGGKGANLAEMTNIGLPVPPGFTISTEACHAYYTEGGKLPAGLMDQVKEALKDLEAKAGAKLGDVNNPLLVSVRSGAKISMPGMMDTILNLGLNDQTVEGLARKTNNPRFAYDSYRRFIQMYGEVVMGANKDSFEHALVKVRDESGVKYDYEIPAEALKKLIGQYKEIVRKETGRDFPQDALEQLAGAVGAVFGSWDTPRAKVYRRQNKISDDLGTAANVQMMVFGNMGNDCGTGVVFTRDPATGEKRFYGEYLMNAQGEDVVAGIRTPKPVAELEKEMPEVYKQLFDTCQLLEKHYADMQDCEFTVQNSKLYMLQTRNGKRTAAAAVKIAYDLVQEGKIDKQKALTRVEADAINSLLHPRIDPKAKLEVIAKGYDASPGAAVGAIVFDADLAEQMGNEGKKVILVRVETTPDDIHGIIPAQGVLTAHGGKTSHAAVVARGMGKPAVCGCEALKIDYAKKQVTIGDRVLKEGDVVSIDGGNGNVYLGAAPLVPAQISAEFHTLLEWADEVRKIGVHANADTPEDARRAREFGATGIGLCRTEHMFMQVERLPVVQEMILADNVDDRKKALAKLLPMQQGDFEGILEAMDGFPVTIRFLDPPLHEFLPNTRELEEQLAELEAKHGSADEIAKLRRILTRAHSLHESNPMMGFRGTRLGVVYPEISEMQARAVLQATVTLLKKGLHPKPEIMIPLVGVPAELKMMRELCLKVKEEIEKENNIKIECPIGTMIELPRAALVADEIAEHAEFFSFGTNDLTQMTFGYSRDDAEGKFLANYLEQKVLARNPFATIDEGGVGKLVKMAVKLGHETRADIHCGVCGEHGGDPESIDFFYRAGLDYVSCSPFRVPVARLAAAQATIKNGGR